MANAADSNTIVPADVVENTSTALGIAAAGLAATLSPAYFSIAARPLGLVMKRVHYPEIIRKMCPYRPCLRPITPAAEAFGDFLVDWAKRWNTVTVGSRRASPTLTKSTTS